MRSKAVAPVISVFLLVLLLVGVAAFVWLFFRGVFQSMFEVGKREEMYFIEVGMARIRIVSARGDKIIVRNEGEITLKNFAVFVDKEKIELSQVPPQLAPDEAGELIFRNPLKDQEHSIKVVSDRGAEHGLIVLKEVARWEAGFRNYLIGILNEPDFNDGGWGAPTAVQVYDALSSYDWDVVYIYPDNLTQDGWKSYDIIIFPKGEDYPAFGKALDCCNSVLCEGSEHDIWKELKEFIYRGGLFIGVWGASLYYPKAWNGTQWVDYWSDCTQYTGATNEYDVGNQRVDDIGISAHDVTDPDHLNITRHDILKSETGDGPYCDGASCDRGTGSRWGWNIDIPLIELHDPSHAILSPGKTIGFKEYGEGWYFYPGGENIFNPGFNSEANALWNDLVEWYYLVIKP
jgi:hypothetical protein